MSSFRIRPHFRHIVDGDAESALGWIVDRLRGGEGRCEVRSFPGYVSLRVPEAEQHFWSPQLCVSLEDDGEGRTVIQGTYGPSTNLWTVFLYGYLIAAVLGGVGTVLGLCQWMIDAQPWGFWFVAGALTVAAGLYFLAQTGQKLGAWQMFQLHQAMESAMEISMPIQ